MFLPSQMKLEGVEVDEEQTVSEPELLGEVFCVSLDFKVYFC